jgi:tetratricopeptide (TPR) repeat protein
LCAWLVGPVAGQEPSRSLQLLADGVAAYQERDWQGCTDALERALAQGFADPLTHLDALVLAGRAYAALGEQERATAHFRQALEAQPDYRLDPSDPNGQAEFAALLAPSIPASAQSGLPTGKILLAALVLGGVAAGLLLLGGGGGGQAVGVITGVVKLP